MITIGVICLILGLVFHIGLLWTLGIILVIIGLVLLLIGAMSSSRTVGGRRFWY